MLSPLSSRRLKPEGLRQMLDAMVLQLVEHPASARVELKADQFPCLLRIHVAATDHRWMGGLIFQSLRVIMRRIGRQQGSDCEVELAESTSSF